MPKTFLFLISILFLVSSCTDHKGLVVDDSSSDVPVPVVLNLVVENVQLESEVQVDTAMFIRAAALKFYLSNISYRDKNGQFVLMRDAFLYDQEVKNDTIQLMIPPSATAIRFGVGVPPGINTGDPTIYGNKHPLSIKGSKGMHWGWNTGYRFVVFEGKRDTLANGNFEEPFSFHTGTDSLYRELTFPVPTQYDGVSLTIDGAVFFKNIDLNTDYSTHTVGNPDLARRFTDNFLSALSLAFSVH